MKFNNERRKFLKKSFFASASTISLMGLVSTNLQAAEVSDEYKAIVCVMLHGGADSFNMVIPTSDIEYSDYEDVRFSVAVDQSEILEFNHTNANGLNNSTYGFRPEMSEMKNLFDQQKLAIVANVGTLRQPLTLSDVSNQNLLPMQLFAHDAQNKEWMFANSKEPQSKGVFARIADSFYPTGNPYFNIGIAADFLSQQGAVKEALRFNSAYVSPNLMSTYGFGPESGGADVGKVYQNMYESGKLSDNKLSQSFSNKISSSLLVQEDLQGLFDNVANLESFNGGTLAQRLEAVAKILSVRNSFPGAKKRQVFVVSYGGWDSHDYDNAPQCNELSYALGKFQDSLLELGIENNVTTFTTSEFGRKVQSNEKGTDHGWGSHHFVMGGAVKGGDIYGKMPLIKSDSPDAWNDRIIPTMSVEEYMAPIIKWFGATDIELNEIFTNLKSFPQNLNNFIKS